MHNLLMKLTKNRPMRTIIVNDQEYLQRYYMGSIFGRQIWLHRFLRNDGERHLHNHPWRGVSIVLAGGYRELLRRTIYGASREIIRRRNAGAVGFIDYHHTHRIASVSPNTWTLMLIGKTRKPTWSFIDDAGNRQIMASAGHSWWRTCEPRQS
jgi:hypothetical protein